MAENIAITLKCINPYYDRCDDKYVKINDQVITHSQERADYLMRLNVCEEVKENTEEVIETADVEE